MAEFRRAVQRASTAAHVAESANEEWAENLRRGRVELDRVMSTSIPELIPVTASVTRIADGDDGDGEPLCEGCGEPLPKRDYRTQAHREVRYHNDACRQRAYRQRRARSS